MFGLKELLKRIINGESLTLEQRFDIINSKRVDLEVIEYLANRFSNLVIEVCGDYEGDILYLMEKGLLEGWCWQTTESSIIFLNDNDYIERGYLKFSKDKDYYHSWVCFKYKSKEFVFDPCLNFLCEKKLYYKIFEIIVNGRTTSKEVRDELILRINTPKEEKVNEQQVFISKFLERHCPDEVNRQRKETQVHGSEDVNSPMYRNNTGYMAELQEGKIKKLVAHFYVSEG